MTAILADLPVREITLEPPQQKVFNDKLFPLMLVPKDDQKANQFLNIDSTVAWIKNQKNIIEDLLLEHGAILFREFPITCPEDFDTFVKAFEYEPLPYVGGAAPRTVVVGNVFTANEAPPEQLIPFHHEMAQVPTYPKILFFHCDIEPSEGGQTPLVLSNEIYKSMVECDEAFVKRLVEHGVQYTRIMPQEDDPSSPIGRGWKSTYQTQDKEEAERKCKDQGTTFEWLPNGCLKTITAVLPAIREDTRTGKKTWFNSIIAAYQGWKDVRNDPQKAITFPDGSQMPEESMKKLGEVFEKHTIAFNWKKGDIVMVDNRQVLHARRSYTPPRRILAALCK
ncbi:hypothetical protein ACJMK2_038766 [Sinanodonta woodiana]|uniref:TauD/TfdA-like domain-containing protein n=1 Tax=Sinanodonta woodiana TaxID=1069815 RepID=A0ABD3W9Y8_SINWO